MLCIMLLWFYTKRSITASPIRLESPCNSFFSVEVCASSSVFISSLMIKVASTLPCLKVHALSFKIALLVYLVLCPRDNEGKLPFNNLTTHERHTIHMAKLSKTSGLATSEASSPGSCRSSGSETCWDQVLVQGSCSCSAQLSYFDLFRYLLIHQVDASSS